MAHKGASNPAKQTENGVGEPSENGDIIPTVYLPASELKKDGFTLIPDSWFELGLPAVRFPCTCLYLDLGVDTARSLGEEEFSFFVSIGLIRVENNKIQYAAFINEDDFDAMCEDIQSVSGKYTNTEAADE